MKKAIVVALSIFLALSTLPAYGADSKANPYGTSTVDPAAPNEVILTVSSKVKSIGFTYSALSKLPSKEITVYEPFLKRRQSFTVIEFRKLFSLAKIAPSDKVVTRALNDYTFTSTASNFLSAGAYLAIKKNGAAIGYDEGGPIRIIFDDKSKWSKNLDAWNWSLELIAAKK